MIEVKNLKKSFIDGESETQVLKGIDFKAETGEFIAIMDVLVLVKVLFYIK